MPPGRRRGGASRRSGTTPGRSARGPRRRSPAGGARRRAATRPARRSRPATGRGRSSRPRRRPRRARSAPRRSRSCSRSRRVAFAVSRIAASSAASVSSSARSRRAASNASPTRPAAFRRGATENASRSRSTSAGARRARDSSAARPGRGPDAEPLQPELDDRPVLAEHGREIRHGADRGEIRQLERGLAEEQSREGEGHAAAREPPLRVRRVGPVRVHDRERLRQDRGDAMMVRDEDVQAGRRSRPRPRRRSRTRCRP